MQNICLVCKDSADVYCTCDSSLRFCCKDYLFYHKPTKGSHQPIDLINKSEEILFKNDSKTIDSKIELKKIRNKLKIDSIKLSKNIQEIK